MRVAVGCSMSARQAYRRAKTDNVIFVCIVRQGRRWKVQLDGMTCIGPRIPDEVIMPVLQSAAEALVLADTVTQASIALLHASENSPNRVVAASSGGAV